MILLMAVLQCFEEALSFEVSFHVKRPLCVFLSISFAQASRSWLYETIPLSLKMAVSSKHPISNLSNLSYVTF